MSQQLRSAFGHYATGVTIVTTCGAANEPVGMTANSFTSLSLDPPLVLWSIAYTSSNFEAFRAARCFAVHVLHAGQDELARVFSTKNVDRFACVATSAGLTGAPLLTDYHACFDFETHAQYEGGGPPDHRRTGAFGGAARRRSATVLSRPLCGDGRAARCCLSSRKLFVANNYPIFAR